jgi:ATP-dependent Clp protease ATP-binding subunit ClpA
VSTGKELLSYAIRIADYYDDPSVSTAHVFLAALGSSNPKIAKALKDNKVDHNKVLQLYNTGLYVQKRGLHFFTRPFDPELEAVLKEMPPKYSDINLLSRSLSVNNDAHTLLVAVGLNPGKIWRDLNALPLKVTPLKKTPNLDKYCKNLSKLAAEGMIDPLIGRKNELTRMLHILGRRRKNNPVLLGPAGVGKSALAEGLALAIHNKTKGFEKLHGKTLYVIDLSLMIAGTKYRGQFEEKLVGVIGELEADPNAIAFIDELHTLVGAGDCEGGTDAANILKPSLARGKIQVIGATTLKEYKMIKVDAALSRRFQPVVLETLGDDQVLQILKGLKTVYETHHGVRYTSGALKAIVRLGNELEGRHAPDAHIDLLDEAGAAATRKTIREKEIEAVFATQCGASQTKVKTVGFGS